MYRLSAGLIVAGVFASVVPQVGAAEAAQTAMINEQIAAGWKAAEIKKPAAKATDAEFLRRVFIDLIGRIATPEEALDFENDKSVDKRAKLVRRLLNDTSYKPKAGGKATTVLVNGKPQDLTFDYADEYAAHWSNMWTVWLMSRTGDARYRDQMRVWLHQGFLENRSHKDMVTQLLSATGKTNDNGAVNFIIHHIGEQNAADKRTELGRFDSVPITSRVTKIFLGLQTQCTQCHDHPFNKEWVQSDFWGVNAYFRQTTLDKLPTRPNDTAQNMMMALSVVELGDGDNVNTSGIVYFERRDGKLMASKPNFLKDLAQADKGEAASKTMATQSGKTRRQALAQYAVSHDNFSRAYVNRIWGHLFGRGLNKEPSIDDFGSHNEVVHPELLNNLGTEFAKYQYNPKMLLEWICTSDAYSLSHVATKEYADSKYDVYFARMPLKALSPEVLFESILTATKSTNSANSLEGRKAREAWMNKLVRNFGDDEGNEMTFNGTVVQALLMMNGKELNESLGEKGSNIVKKIVDKHSKGGVTSPTLVIDELFLMTLNRHPTADERAKILSLQQKGAVIAKEVAPKDEPKPPAGTGATTPKPVVPVVPPKGKGPNKPAPGPATPPGFVAPTSPNDATFYQDLFWALLNTNEFMLNH